MFRPNLDVEIAPLMGFNGYGKRTYAAWQKARAAIIYLRDSADPTSVRTDSSASRSSAIDSNIQARMLFPKNVKLKQGDQVRIPGVSKPMTVQLVFPRHAVPGHLDHWQVDLDIYQG